MILSRIDLAIVAMELSKHEFIEEYDVLKMLRISKRKLDEECNSGNLRRNIIGNRAYFRKYDVEKYALGEIYAVR